MTEGEPHSIITERMREFKKLKRVYLADMRQGKLLDSNEFQRLVALDAWLAANNPDWHQNFPDTMREDYEKPINQKHD